MSTTEPDRISGMGSDSGAAPQRNLTPWLTNRITPKCRDHLIEVVAIIEMAENGELEQQPEN